MRKTWKALFASVLAMTMTVGMSTAILAEDTSNDESAVAPVSGSVMPSGEYKMAFSGSDLANPWVTAVKNGFEDACAYYGIECESLNGQSDVEKQVRDIESVVGGGYNAVVMNPIDGNALESTLNDATAQGVASITIAQRASAATAGIEMDDYRYGTIIAGNAVDWIKENLDGKAVIAVLAEDNIESSIKRGDAIVDTLTAELPDSEIIARQQGNTPEQGLSVIENLLIANPDLNVVVACNDSGGIGAYQAFDNAGLAHSDNCGIFSGDNTDEARTYIMDETSIYRGTADLYPYQAGYQAVELAIQYLNDGLPEKHQVINLDMGPVTKEQVISEES